MKRSVLNVFANHVEGGEVMNEKNYFQNVTIAKIAIITIIFFFIMMVIGAITSKGESHSVKESIEKQSLEIDTLETGWITQIIYDSVNACYQGTWRWIVMSNPALIGIIPPPPQQRAMIEHCFCVLDRVRKQYSFVEYMKVASNLKVMQSLYYETALKCVTENGTLQGILYLKPKSDNETKKDNKTTIEPEKSKDSPKESLPDQPEKKDSNGLPDTIFQG